MRNFSSFGQLATFLQRQAIPDYKRNLNNTLERTGQEVVHQVETMIGVQQPAIGPYPAWDPLAAATISRKARRGLGKGGDPATPLYATGAFSNDISFRVMKTTHTVFVGTHLEKMKVHEFGNAKTPPRPIFGPAAFVVVPKMIPMIRLASVAGISGMGYSTFVR